MQILSFALFIFALGWIAHSWLGGQWRWVPGKPKLNQDARHFWVRSDGRTLAFTTEQLAVAQTRAANLTTPRQLWQRRAVWAAAFAVLILGMIFG